MIKEPDWENIGISSAISPRFLELYASIVMQQTKIEHSLQLCIGYLLGVDYEKVQILTAEQSYRQLVGLLSSLMIKHYSQQSEQYKKLKFILSKIDDFEKLRNDLVHSIWMHSNSGALESGAQRMKITAKRKIGLKRIEESVTESELEIEWKKGSFYDYELQSHIKSCIQK